MVSIAGGTPQGRAQLASNRATWNNLSGVLFSYAFTGVTAVLAGSAIESAGLLYAACAFLFGIVMVIGYFIHFKITDGYEEIEAAEMMEEENSWINDDDIDFDEYEDYYEEN